MAGVRTGLLRSPWLVAAVAALLHLVALNAHVRQWQSDLSCLVVMSDKAVFRPPYQ